MSLLCLRLRSMVVAFLAGLAVAGADSTISLANPRYAGIVVDAYSGRVLYANQESARRYPASITKAMTLYLLFEELEAGRLTLGSQLSVSNLAARQPPSKVGVQAGSTISVIDAIGVLVTKSANDVAVVVAENVSGDIASFAQRMTRTARNIGMTNTTFHNPHGLPHPGQVSTAVDIATLAHSLQFRFPQYFSYFSLRSYAYEGVSYRNHNRLLGEIEGLDGVKTGFTRASGFNLVSSLRRDGRHIIGVVLGGRTAARRDARMREILKEALPRAERSPASPSVSLPCTVEGLRYPDRTDSAGTPLTEQDWAHQPARPKAG